MSDYLKVFNTTTERNTFRSGANYVEPHVSCTADGENVKYNKYFNANGHAYVDLGLPSGTLWATKNVGANTPQDEGDYFAWGETESKQNYWWDTYEHGTGSPNLTKYNDTDNKIVLDLEDDAARVNWGGSWKIPTPAQFQELVEECTFTWDSTNNGYIVSSNDNSIFIPAGYFYSGTTNGMLGDGLYWTSSLYENDNDDACDIYFSSSETPYVDREHRCYGMSIRPVILPE